MSRPRAGALSVVLLMFIAVVPSTAVAQATALARGSDNIDVLGHLPLGAALSVLDMDIEQEMSRPYAYVGRARLGLAGPRGMDIVSIENPERPELLYEWRIEDQELHLGAGGMDVNPSLPTYVRHGARKELE